MNTLALLLVLLGSLLHIGWNSLLKQAEEKLSFLWLSMGVALPFGLLYSAFHISFQVFTYFHLWIALATIGLHVLYVVLLTNAYRFGDLSFVYPYCRGVGTLLATLGGFIFFKERPSLMGWIGITLTLVGSLLEPVWLGRRATGQTKKTWLFSLFAGAAIAGYLLVDMVGVRRFDPTTYMVVIFVGMYLCITPSVIKRRQWRQELRRAGSKILWASLFMSSAYVVVLFAMQIAPISYVVATRATGILASGFIGWLFLHERLNRIRLVAIGCIGFGVLFVGFA